jgi:four helix bundle protein
MRDESKANDLEDRLIGFAVRVIKVATALPRTPVGRHLSEQLLRSGTSPAPNYAEARGSESRADFAHKLKIAVQELNETRVWLRIIGEANVVKQTLLEPLLGENDQLCRIMNAAVTTARQRPSTSNHSQKTMNNK